jgi:predicted DNA binding CopG/RHH family protein
MKRKPTKLRKVPIFKSDEEAAAFLDQDLSDLDFSQFKPMHFEIRPKDTSVNLRLSAGLLDAVRANAKREGVPYQRYIRHILERAVSEPGRKRQKAKAS